MRRARSCTQLPWRFGFSELSDRNGFGGRHTGVLLHAAGRIAKHKSEVAEREVSGHFNAIARRAFHAAAEVDRHAARVVLDKHGASGLDEGDNSDDFDPVLRGAGLGEFGKGPDGLAVIVKGSATPFSSTTMNPGRRPDIGCR